MRALLFVALTQLSLSAAPSAARPMTYQGRLDDAGSPANGMFDFVFRVYDDLNPGAPDTLFDSETVLFVEVIDGRFTTEIPFSPITFDDNGPRYLEIAVRPHNVGPFTTLLPRQQVTAAPYAYHADIASDLDLPATMNADTGAVDTAALTVLNTGTAGTGLVGDGASSGVRGHAGTISGSPLTAALPAGVYGIGEATGVAGSSGSGVGVYGASHMGTAGEFVITHAPNAKPALIARTPSTADDAFAIHAIMEATTAGAGSAAVRGESRATNGLFSGIGVWGSHEGLGWGVYGTSVTGTGVRGFSESGWGVYGQSLDDDAIRGFTSGPQRAGFFEINNTDNEEACVYARTDSTQPNAFGVHGWVEGPNAGSFSAGVRGENGGTGGTGIGVWGSHDGAGTGVYGSTVNGIGVWGQETGSGFAGFFSGNVSVIGNLSKSSGTFKIDHPLDPANKYLSHSFVESPDMKNIYDGVITLGSDGRAEVTLPEYFGALNENFRYQLTCIGGFAPVYIEREISANTFVIAGGPAGLRVSWQVTGSRKDAYALANPIVVEQDKPRHERGRYLHPEAHGHPPELGVGHRAPSN